RTREDLEGGSQRRRGTELRAGGAPGPGAPEVPHSFPPSLELDRPRNGDPEPRRRRDGLRPAHARGAAPRARRRDLLPHEQHPGLADPPRRARRVRVAGVTRIVILTALVVAGAACRRPDAERSGGAATPSPSAPPASAVSARLGFGRPATDAEIRAWD